jgi:hypothetical protein
LIGIKTKKKPNLYVKILIFRIDSNSNLFKQNIGMEITIFNLVKKSPRVYKASSGIAVAARQHFDLYQSANTPTIKPLTAAAALRNHPNAANYLHQSLIHNTSQIFNVLYTQHHQNQAESTKNQPSVTDTTDRVNLLLGDTAAGAATGVEHKFLAQIVKIYDLNLKIKCPSCTNLLNSCSCINSTKTANCESDYRIEFTFNFLIDDHTSILRLNYANQNYNLSGGLSRQSSLFKPIAGYVASILRGYLNELSLPSVPFKNNATQSDALAQLYQAFKEKISAGGGSFQSSSGENTTLFNNGNGQFDDSVKLDVCKALYDYLMYAVVGKYFVFYVDLAEAGNVMEVSRQRAASSAVSNSGYKSKGECGHFKLSEMESNEQFKSTLQLTCSRFVPVDVEFC